MSEDRLTGVRSSLGCKAPVVVASTGVLSMLGLQTIDGIALAENDRILVKDQANPIENGIRVAGAGAWPRALDFDGNTDFVGGTLIPVARGNLHAGKIFHVASADPLVVDASELEFSQVTQAGEASAASIASATTTDLGSVSADAITITGSVSIASFGGSAATGTVKTIYYSGSPLLIHGPNLLLPGELDIQAGIGHRAVVRHEGSGVWLVLVHTRANGHPLITGTATMASAATTDLGSTLAQSISITGSTTITSFGATSPTGATKFVTLEGAIALTHSSAIILPGGVSIQGATGDTFIAKHDSSGIWRVLNYTRALPSQLSITPVANSSTAEQTLMQQAIAAGRLASVRNYVKVKAWGNCSTASTAAPRRVRLGFGGTFVVESGASIPAGANWSLEATIAYVSTGAQVASGTIVYSTSATGGGSVGTVVTGPAENPAGAINILLNSITTGGTGQLTAYGLLVEVV